MSRDLLDDLLADVPAHVHADAAAAWREGGARRTRRRAGLAALAAVVVALAGLGFSLFPRGGTVEPAPAPSGDAGVDGHPVRVEAPWRMADLPRTPGPVAAVVELKGEDSRSWAVVSADGKVYRVPDVDPISGMVPTLSPDGRVLVYLRAFDRQGTGDANDALVLRDLGTGRERALDEIGSGTSGPSRPSSDTYVVQQQAPYFWSSDGARLLLYAFPLEDIGTGTSTALVVGLDGSVQVLQNPPGAHVYPAGWIDDETVGWVSWKLGKDQERVRSAELVRTDVEGAVTGRTVLAVPSGRSGVSQWSQILTPDGRAIALSTDSRESAALVDVLATETGELVDVAEPPFDYDSVCQLRWRDGVLDFPLYGDTYDDERTEVLLGTAGKPLVVAAPGLHAGCTVWAADALTGKAHPGFTGHVFGTSTRWPTWHWRELGAGLVLLATVLALLGWRRRRRQREIRTGIRVTVPRAPRQVT